MQLDKKRIKDSRGKTKEVKSENWQHLTFCRDHQKQQENNMRVCVQLFQGIPGKKNPELHLLIPLADALEWSL